MENNRIEEELRRIELKLERGSLNHIRNMVNKATHVKISNEEADHIAYMAKLKNKEDENQCLSQFVQKFYNKHKKVKEVKKELKIEKDQNR